MLKIFLVEDETIIRESIKNNIDWLKEGFDFVGEAGDGELAYPMIKNLRPDILITDIKMPFMDGLELSRLIKRELPQTKIIILSGYNEFEYAKEAISIKVTEYLLKPISSVELLEAVNRVANQIEEEREQAETLKLFQEEMIENKELQRKRFFNDLIQGTSSLSEILEKGDELNIPLLGSAYNILLLKIIPANGQETIYSNEVLSIISQLKEKMENLKNIFLFDSGINELTFLFRSDSEEDCKATMEDLLDYLNTILNHKEEIRYFGGMGKIVRRLSELPESFEEASRAFSYRYLIESNQIISCDQIKGIAIWEEEDLELNSKDVKKVERDILLNFLKSGLKEEVSVFVDEYFEKLGKDSLSSLMFRQYIAMDMFFCTVTFREEMGYETEKLTEESQASGEMGRALNTIEGTKKYLKAIIEKTIELRDKASVKKYGNILEEAKKYIAANFSNEEISLNSVAASVNISPSYFSSIFSQEMGKTFVEYLTEVRMEKAKELLRCTSMKSSEIGFEVGYKDPHYFSHLFKKTQNCTPKEFKKLGNE